jgi:hypothetical protein
MPTLPRHSPEYRCEEIALITEFARQGQSSAFVGIAGVGKSNISTCLQRDHTVLFCPDLDTHLQIRYLNVDCNDWDGTIGGCWRLLRENMENAWGGIATTSNDEYLIVRRTMKNACQQPHSRVVIILDDCDRALDKALPALANKLRTLRDDNRDRLSYLLFTKHLPQRLGPADNRLRDGMFFQLFHSHIFTLRPYNERDAMHMLAFLNARASISLEADDLRSLYHLSGGYAALIRTLFETYETQPPPNPDLLTHFSHHADVQSVLRRLLNYLHRHEQSVLHRLAHRQKLRAEDAPALDLLKKRGVLQDDAEPFSLILTQYLRNHSTPPF